MKTVCTRFAPSPTGFLHLGGARTALFSWLYARRHNGHFVLRIEDTDLERSFSEATKDIKAALQWMGLSWDSGPFYQSRRLDRYREAIERLLFTGHAYPCYCTSEELAKSRAEQIKNKQKLRYDGRCRERKQPRSGAQAAIRFKNPEHGSVSFEDQVFGKITIHNSELDDWIVQRANGMPTYNFCVVVDDADMAISHVIRGEDHINNVPKQINLLTALEMPVPIYAHVPTVLDENGNPLSKRSGARSITSYRQEGYLPEALLNYLVRVGWSAEDKEIFSLAEMIELFNFASVNPAPARLNHKKLDSLNRHYLTAAQPDALTAAFAAQVRAEGMDPASGEDLKSIAFFMVKRCATLREMAKKSMYFFVEELDYAALEVDMQQLREAVPRLVGVRDMLAGLAEWSSDEVAQGLKNFCSENGVTMNSIGPPLRTALTAGLPAPGIKDVVALLGKNRCLARLDSVIKGSLKQAVNLTKI